MKLSLSPKIVLAGIVIGGCIIMLVNMIFFTPTPGSHNPTSEFIPPASHPSR